MWKFRKEIDERVGRGTRKKREEETNHKRLFRIEIILRVPERGGGGGVRWGGRLRRALADERGLLY